MNTNVATAEAGVSVADPIDIEILRSRVQTVAEEAAETIYRTAISPVVTEGKDYSATLLDPEGNLIAGGGLISLHWLAATRATRTITEKFSDTLAAGDVFLINDPYQGGGLHPSDVFVNRPIFVADRLVAWISLSAHMLDIGGLAMGSFAPAATECFQEGLRIPAVRLFRAGVECSDVWDLLRTNVRLSQLVEMDLRGLVAGAHVAQERACEIATSMGVEVWVAGIAALRELSERELRRRLRMLADGTYRARTWTQWEDRLLETPCTMTVTGDHVHFDFTGSSDQVPFFINSQPYIIMSSFLSLFCPQFLPDLPYNQGVLAPFSMTCPEGTIVHAVAPAPVAAGHMHVAFNASEAMMQCIRLAAWASEPALPHTRVSAWNALSGIGLSSWAGADVQGQPDGWVFMEGSQPGAPAGWGRDGEDCSPYCIPTYGVDGPDTPAMLADIEIMETWHPILITDRKLRSGLHGAGRWRSGGGLEMRVEVRGTPKVVGQMLGMRGRMALEGVAGGSPGDTTEFHREDAEGQRTMLELDASNVELAEGEAFTLRCSSGGGVGDPLDRDPELVVRDIAEHALDREAVRAVYGVVVDADGTLDAPATDALRAATRRDRLRRAAPAARTVDDSGERPQGDRVPLYPGVVQVGHHAIAENSNALLAEAPHHWTDGCPTLEEERPGPGPGVVHRTYLDPRTGACLHTEVVPRGAPRNFEVSPTRWTG